MLGDGNFLPLRDAFQQLWQVGFGLVGADRLHRSSRLDQSQTSLRPVSGGAFRQSVFWLGSRDFAAWVWILREVFVICVFACQRRPEDWP